MRLLTRDEPAVFFYLYLRSTDFLLRLCVLTKQLRPALYLPVAATTSNRVRQMDRRNDTAPLNRKCDHCLRSPHWTHSVSAHWGKHLQPFAVPADIYTLRASGLTGVHKFRIVAQYRSPSNP